MKKKVVFACSGLGYINRGLENFTETLFHKIKDLDAFETRLLRGRLHDYNSEQTEIQHLPRHSRLNRLLSKVIRRHPFEIQNISFALGTIPFLIRTKPDVIYTGEPVVYLWLKRIRKIFGLSFKMILFTGGQTIPAAFDSNDLVHHVTDALVSHADYLKIPKSNQFLIPHFIDVDKFSRPNDKSTYKKQLNLPKDKKVILSVGAIDATVKRMEYVIDEVSALPSSDYHLVILGEFEEETPLILQRAKEKLIHKNYIIATIRPHKVVEYFHAADIFVLASLKEGFGMVYLDALAAGLPIITHDHVAGRYVLGNFAYRADLSQPGTLKNLIPDALNDDSEKSHMDRQMYALEKYSWFKLQSRYLDMFKAALALL
jgi:1,2-diacylglycerol 3-alpha-glucosyltransferase